MALNFTVIQHGFRREHGLSCVEYVLCDMVYYLSNSDVSPVPGWCFMSKEQIAAELDLSKQAILNMVDRMIDAGFLYKNDHTKHLKTTAKWQAVYFTAGKETLPQPGQLSLLGGGKETLPNKDSSYNNSIDKEKKVKNEKIEFLKKVIEFAKEHTNKYPKFLYVQFSEYWLETSASGKKMRFQEQKFFELSRRLATFHSGCKNLSELWEKEKNLPTLNILLRKYLPDGTKKETANQPI